MEWCGRAFADQIHGTRTSREAVVREAVLLLSCNADIPVHVTEKAPCGLGYCGQSVRHAASGFVGLQRPRQRVFADESRW